MEVSEPKSVNPVLKTIEVNSLRLGGLQIMYNSSNNRYFPFSVFLILYIESNISYLD